MPDLPNWLEAAIVMSGFLLADLLGVGCYLYYQFNRGEIELWLDRTRIKIHPSPKAMST